MAGRRRLTKADRLELARLDEAAGQRAASDRMGAAIRGQWADVRPAYERNVRAARQAHGLPVDPLDDRKAAILAVDAAHPDWSEDAKADDLHMNRKTLYYQRRKYGVPRPGR